MTRRGEPTRSGLADARAIRPNLPKAGHARLSDRCDRPAEASCDAWTANGPVGRRGDRRVRRVRRVHQPSPPAGPDRHPRRRRGDRPRRRGGPGDGVPVPVRDRRPLADRERRLGCDPGPRVPAGRAGDRRLLRVEACHPRPPPGDQPVRGPRDRRGPAGAAAEPAHAGRHPERRPRGEPEDRRHAEEAGGRGDRRGHGAPRDRPPAARAGHARHARPDRGDEPLRRRLAEEPRHLAAAGDQPARRHRPADADEDRGGRAGRDAGLCRDRASGHGAALRRTARRSPGAGDDRGPPADRRAGHAAAAGGGVVDVRRTARRGQGPRTDAVADLRGRGRRCPVRAVRGHGRAAALGVGRVGRLRLPRLHRPSRRDAHGAGDQRRRRHLRHDRGDDEHPGEDG